MVNWGGKGGGGGLAIDHVRKVAAEFLKVKIILSRHEVQDLKSNFDRIWFCIGPFDTADRTPDKHISNCHMGVRLTVSISRSTREFYRRSEQANDIFIGSGWIYFQFIPNLI